MTNPTTNPNPTTYTDEEIVLLLTAIAMPPCAELTPEVSAQIKARLMARLMAQVDAQEREARHEANRRKLGRQTRAELDAMLV